MREKGHRNASRITQSASTDHQQCCDVLKKIEEVKTKLELGDKNWLGSLDWLKSFKELAAQGGTTSANEDAIVAVASPRSTIDSEVDFIQEAQGERALQESLKKAIIPGSRHASGKTALSIQYLSANNPKKQPRFCHE